MRMMAAATAVLLAFPLSSAVIPRQAPEISITLPGGRVVKPSQYKGKVVVLEFLLTTCPHCQRASQTIEKVYKEFGGQVQPIGAAVNDNATNLVPDYIRNFKLSYPVGVSNRDAAIAFLQHPIMMSMLMPQLVFIDKNGAIQAQYSGNDPFFANEEQNVRQLLKKLTGTAEPAKKPATSAAPKKKAS